MHYVWTLSLQAELQTWLNKLKDLYTCLDQEEEEVLIEQRMWQENHRAIWLPGRLLYFRCSSAYTYVSYLSYFLQVETIWDSGSPLINEMIL